MLKYYRAISDRNMNKNKKYTSEKDNIDTVLKNGDEYSTMFYLIN